jgi:hypothetical protein
MRRGRGPGGDARSGELGALAALLRPPPDLGDFADPAPAVAVADAVGEDEEYEWLSDWLSDTSDVSEKVSDDDESDDENPLLLSGFVFWFWLKRSFCARHFFFRNALFKAVFVRSPNSYCFFGGEGRRGESCVSPPDVGAEKRQGNKRRGRGGRRGGNQETPERGERGKLREEGTNLLLRREGSDGGTLAATRHLSKIFFSPLSSGIHLCHFREQKKKRSSFLPFFLPCLVFAPRFRGTERRVFET